MSTQRLDDGFSTVITFSLDATIKLYEKEVTPPGISAGGEVDITTMRNTTWRTRNPRALKTLTPVSAKVAYATEVYDSILSQIGVNQLISVTFPDNSAITFWGWLDEFTPGAHTEGEQPTATITVIPSNKNNSGVESAPDYDESSGAPS